MDYINHLQNLYRRLPEDSRLKPRHISAYLALVHLWEINRFHNPIPLEREKTMELAKIGSVSTYLKTLKELNEYGYILYNPSKSRLNGTRVTIPGFEASNETIAVPTVDKAFNADNASGQESNTYFELGKRVHQAKNKTIHLTPQL